MGKEEPLPVDRLQFRVERFRRDSCDHRMRGQAEGPPVDAEGLLVIVVQEVAEEAGEAVGDISDEAHRLPVVSGNIFGEFPVDVVGGEQGVVDRTGQGGGDPDMGKEVLVQGCLKERESAESGGVGGVFIGIQGEGGTRRGVPVGGDVLEEGGEGSGQGASGGFPEGVQGFLSFFLLGSHGTFAAEGGVGEAVDELGSFAHGNMDVVGEELVKVEAFVAIGGEVFLEVVGAEAVLVKEEGISAEAVETVLDRGGGTTEDSSDGTQILS